MNDYIEIKKDHRIFTIWSPDYDSDFEINIETRAELSDIYINRDDAKKIVEFLNKYIDG